MPSITNPAKYLAQASIAPEIFQLRPDYRALLIIATNIPPADSSTNTRSDSSNPSPSESLLRAAESHAKSLLTSTALTEIPHISAWRKTYTAFGSKPKKFPSSLESLMRRAASPAGLPRINPLTDIYNAISVLHEIPIGGEDLSKYEGAPRLIVAKGDEEFDARAGGEVVLENPERGEVVWCDERGVTCRRWNWRQGVRTGLSGDSREVLFIFDALEVCGDGALDEAGDALVRELHRLGTGVKVVRRVLRKE